MTNERSGVLSIDVDYCRNEQDLRELVNLFTKVLLYCKESKDNGRYSPDISFSQTHADIISCLKGRSELDIYNIDHHHDIYYDPEELMDFDRGVVCENNWVGWLIRSQTLNSYHWVKNSDSELLPPEDMIALQSQNISYGKRAVKIDKDGLVNQDRLVFLYNSPRDANIPLPNLSDVFVCMSPEYLSSKFHFVYFLLIDLAKNIVGDKRINIF